MCRIIPTLLLSIVTLVVSLPLQSCGGGSDDVVIAGDGDVTPAPTVVASGTLTPSVTATPVAGGRVWNVAEVLAVASGTGTGTNVSCGGELGFRRCVCVDDVPSTVRYRPAVAECNGNAGAFLSGNLFDAFSVVVRDTQNRDRWPAAGSGFGGCSAALANSEDPPKRCSAFKVQDTFVAVDGVTRVHCFGASGYSEIFKDAARLTVKISDDPNSSDDEIERYCLAAGNAPLN